MPGRMDAAGDAVRRLVRSADEPLEVLPLTEEQIQRLIANDPWAKKPKQTMDRFAGVLQKRGMAHVGTIKDIEADMIGRPSHELGPGGITPNTWVSMLRVFEKSPDSTPVYVGDPVAAVASQYPVELRQQAIDTARQFQMPLRKGGAMRFQMALGEPDQKAVLLAYPRRRVVESGATGLAHFGARGNAPGLIEVAAGRAIRPEYFDRVLLHELRHTLEGGGMGAPYSIGGYQDWRMPREGAVVGPAKKSYLSQTGEEVARFGDARARYATHTGRLISDEDEAERAAEMILSNRFGLGEGFYNDERAFYRAAREADSNIRAHQNRLLQRILSLGPAAALPYTAEE